MIQLLSLISIGLYAVNALEPLEPASGIYFGPWYDRIHGDTPESIQRRVNHKPFSFFQSDMNIDAVFSTWNFTNFMEQMPQDLNTIAYLTLYPMKGFVAVSEAALKNFTDLLNGEVIKGRRFFIRYASEMNGNWFPYGQQPTPFKESWIRVVKAVRDALGANVRRVAFIWAPNAGNGYPFGQAEFSITKASDDYPVLDTNKDGELNTQDDPYTPYYPGDEYVDWVGFSIYHYGKEWPWITNDVPEPDKFEQILMGRRPDSGPFNFYDMYSVRKEKPFMVTETGSTFHLRIDPDKRFSNPTPNPVRPAPGPGRVAIKQAWWRQYLNSNFLSRYPKIKGASTFEFIKHEEDTWRDFTNMGDTRTGINSPFGNDGGSQAGPVLAAFRADLIALPDGMINYAKQGIMTDVETGPAPPGSKKPNSSSARSFNALIVLGLMVITTFIFL